MYIEFFLQGGFLGPQVNFKDSLRVKSLINAVSEALNVLMGRNTAAGKV